MTSLSSFRVSQPGNFGFPFFGLRAGMFRDDSPTMVLSVFRQ